MSLYSSLGTWVEENHGKGSIHYCLSDNLSTMEIYPLKKNNPIETINLAIEYVEHDNFAVISINSQ